MVDPGSAGRPGVSGTGPMEYPTNRVVGAVDRMKLGEVVPDLIDAGFAPVGILAGEAGLRRLAETGGGHGLVGLMRHFTKSTGGELDHIRQAEQELRAGHVLVDVEVSGDAEKERARDVLVRHGGHFVAYFGHWTIETLV